MTAATSALGTVPKRRTMRPASELGRSLYRKLWGRLNDSLWGRLNDSLWNSLGDSLGYSLKDSLEDSLGYSLKRKEQ